MEQQWGREEEIKKQWWGRNRKTGQSLLEKKRKEKIMGRKRMIQTETVRKHRYREYVERKNNYFMPVCELCMNRQK